MEDEKKQNTPKELIEFLSEGTEKVTPKEFRDFWGSLSDEEKTEYKNADLG